METTTINLTFTKITFFDSETEISKSIEVQGKATVKQCKEIIPADSIFITKSTEVDTFEVDTNELMKLRIEQN